MVRSVRALRPIIAIVLAALWLPSTQHCGLEAAGLIAAQVADADKGACCDSAGGSCTHDACEVVEGVLFKSGTTSLKIAPTLLFADLSTPVLLLPPTRLAVEPGFECSEPGDSRQWTPVWAFVRRAAPLSRAPSLIG